MFGPRTEEEKKVRHESALFWEERNVWYSDVWMDIKGTDQALPGALSRLRSASYPFELAYRLINMYSVKGDVVLDPFLGTGTTVAAAMTSGRNSIGVEIDRDFREIIRPMAYEIVDFSNEYIHNRIVRHYEFVENRKKASGPLRYTNRCYGCPVVTSQEQQAILNDLEDVRDRGDDTFEVHYSACPQRELQFEGLWRSEDGVPVPALSLQKAKQDNNQYRLKLSS